MPRPVTAFPGVSGPLCVLAASFACVSAIGCGGQPEGEVTEPPAETFDADAYAEQAGAEGRRRQGTN